MKQQHAGSSMQAPAFVLYLWGHSQPPAGICNDPATAFLCWRQRCSTKWITLTSQERSRERRRLCVCVCEWCLRVSLVEEWGFMSHLFRLYNSNPHRLQTIYNHPEPPTEAVGTVSVPVAWKMCLHTVFLDALTRPHAPPVWAWPSVLWWEHLGANAINLQILLGGDGSWQQKNTDALAYSLVIFNFWFAEFSWVEHFSIMDIMIHMNYSTVQFALPSFGFNLHWRALGAGSFFFFFFQVPLRSWHILI